MIPSRRRDLPEASPDGDRHRRPSLRGPGRLGGPPGPRAGALGAALNAPQEEHLRQAAYGGGAALGAAGVSRGVGHRRQRWV